MPGRGELRFRPRSAARPVERLAAALLALLAAFAAAAQRPAERIEESEPIRVDSPRRELLNSERIERRFGSYGIDVLESGGRYRVSNLYSVHDGAKVGRTYAVVAYPARIDPSIRAEHEEILAGGSIGAVFARNGWTVEKTHLYFGELPATTKVAALMRADEGAPLAVHVYVLTVVRDGMSFDYATIAEVHHPDYLTRDDLPRIYGAPAASDAADPSVRAILDETEARMR